MDDAKKMNDEPVKQDEGKSEPASELETCRKERDEYLAGWQRARADFANYKKEELERLAELSRYATEGLIRELIVALDNFDLGIAALERQGPVEKGVYMIRAQIEDILKKYGLARIPIKPGDAFDPAYAEAVAEADSSEPPGTIAEVIEAGYKLHDKVARPARVKISKNK